MAHDVFISYAHEDKLVADAVCAKLEERGIRCWVAPRDVLPGEDWGEAIVTAIDESRLMVLVFSANSNASEHVKDEVERTVSRGKPILPFRVQDVEPSGSLALHLSRRHWLDALTPPLEQHLARLAETTHLLLSRLADHEAPVQEDARVASAVAEVTARPQEQPEEAPAPTQAAHRLAEQQSPAKAPRAARDLIRSALGNEGPAFVEGLTPSALGWGGDGAAYPGKFVVNPVDGAELVWVSAGEFLMGSTEEELDRIWRETGWAAGWRESAAREQPAHRVEISRGFWLWRHQVTNAQYAHFLEATGHPPHDSWDHHKSFDCLPVETVTWHDAVAYARWAEGTLPTEAQWEWSARGPDRRLFPWGDRWDRSLCCCAEYWAQGALNDSQAWETWYKGIGAKKKGAGGWTMPARAITAHLKPVGSFHSGASWCGALDMAGNVWEWCADWYGEDHYRSAPAKDAAGPDSGSSRVLRGGSWISLARGCRSAYRYCRAQTSAGYAIGFRVARSF